MNASRDLASRLALAMLFGFGLVSCAAQADENPAPADPSLLPVFKQFGGKAGIDALMEDFMIELVEDPHTSEYFAEVDQKHVKEMLAEQFCVILGGPCTYTGKSMKETHAKLAINEGGFAALIENLQQAMNKHKIPFRAQNKLLAKLAPMHREIVTRP